MSSAEACRTVSTVPFLRLGCGALCLGRMGMGAAYGRRHDLVRDVKVPDCGAAACGELRHELRQVAQILDRPSREPEAARDAGEIAVAEHGAFLGHSLGTELMDFGAV